MADKVRVFVSHHHSPEEDAFTARLVSDLEAAGADVWVDTAGISSGSFVAKISEGLEGRQWLVLVMTPAALASPWVRAEVEAALQEIHAGRMLGVIPLMMQSCQDQDLPILWRTLQRYDATRDYDAALSGLLKALGLTPPAKAALPDQQPGSARPVTQPGILPQREAPTAGAPARSAMLTPHQASLGYKAKTINGVEVILPPVCDVPAGEFLMGSDAARDTDAQGNETPLHNVTLPSFQITTFPVTVNEYQYFVRSGHPEPKSRLNSLTWQQQRAASYLYPVVNVSWHDAVAYASWLAMVTGETWRLPSEAEWEKAARWDPTTWPHRSLIYPWGASFDKTNCNTRETDWHWVSEVGNYRTGASPCFAQDMSGNVWEWTSSIYQAYPYTASDGRENLDSKGARVLRGGSWKSDARSARLAFRNFYPPDYANNDFGFRLIRDIPTS